MGLNFFLLILFKFSTTFYTAYLIFSFHDSICDFFLYISHQLGFFFLLPLSLVILFIVYLLIFLYTYIFFFLHSTVLIISPMLNFLSPGHLTSFFRLLLLFQSPKFIIGSLVISYLFKKKKKDCLCIYLYVRQAFL